MTDSAVLTRPVEPLRAARRTFTRDRILTAAREIFAKNGYGGTTIEQIAQAAGTQRSTLYNHFRDKTEILAAIAQDYRASLVTLIEHLPGPVPTRAEIEQWLTRITHFSAQERTPTLLFMSLGSSLDVPEALDSMGGTLMHAFAERIPAFARALEPGQHLAMARAMALIQQTGWLCVHHAQQRHPELAAAMVAVTADQFEAFLDKTYPTAS